MTTSTTDATNAVGRRELQTGCDVRNRRVMGISAAVAAAVLVALLATGPLGVTLVVTDGQRVQLGSVIGVTVLVGLLGWGVVTLLERLTRRPRGLWFATAVVVLVLSLVGPTAATTAAALVTLAVLHLVVGLILLVTLAPRYRG